MLSLGARCRSRVFIHRLYTGTLLPFLILGGTYFVSMWERPFNRIEPVWVGGMCGFF